MDSIINKFYYNSDFEYIIDYWKNNLKCPFYQISNDNYMIFIKENNIDLILKSNDKSIPVDCRIFSHFYASYNPMGFSIMIIKKYDAVDISIPKNTYYISLSKEINTKECDIELRTCLQDLQGQWITKIEETNKNGNNLYIGILKNGYKISTLNDWFKLYSELIKNKIKDNLLTLQNNDIMKILTNVLDIRIKGDGIKLDLNHYDCCGKKNISEQYIEN